MLTVNHIDIPETKGCKAGTLKIYDGPIGENPVQLAGKWLFAFMKGGIRHETCFRLPTRVKPCFRFLQADTVAYSPENL